MLHRIVMVGLVVAGLVVAGLGVASATVWRPSDTVVMTTGEVSAAVGAPETTLLTTAPGVLSLVDDDVTVTARSSDGATVVVAVGSTVDVAGWVGDDGSRTVTGASDWETLTVEDRPASGTEPGDDAADDAADEQTDEPVAPGPDPTGSDMWVESTSGTGSVSLRWDASSTDQVLLVAAVGEDAAAPQLTLSWPREVTTPLLWPAVALGAVLVVLGVVLGVLGGRRRRRGAAGAPRPEVHAAAQHVAPAGGTLTRRQLREQAEREQQAAEAAARPKRQWPWTGAVPVVEPASTPGPGGDDTEPEPAPEPHRPAWLPEGTGSTSGSGWRAAWGVTAPVTTDTAPAGDSDAVPAGDSDAAPSGDSDAVPAGDSDERPVSPGTAAAEDRLSLPDAPARATPAAPVPQGRPVDQTSPFQRITLRSSDESAPARRIRRDQQPTPWSAPRSPWARPVRPPVEPGDTAAPTADTSKDSE